MAGMGQTVSPGSTIGISEADVPVLIDPGTYIFYNATMSRNHDPAKNYPGEYSIDLIAAAAVGFLDDAIKASDRPFFLGVAPIAPHSETITGAGPARFNAPVPAKRHEHLFPNVTVPRTPNFNPNTTGSASYFKTLRQLNESEIAFNDAWYRKRLQSLQSVDELIDSVIARLSASPDVLNNTYLIYTTDNGYHIGQHRLPPGKSCNIEEDVNIPFFIRGPGVRKGAVQTVPSSHTDIVPTLFALAGIPPREDFDGEVIPVTEELLKKSTKSEHVNIEFWGEYLVEGNTFRGVNKFPQNTYKHVRVVGEGYDLAYAVWCTNEHELYDMAVSFLLLFAYWRRSVVLIPSNRTTPTSSPTWPISPMPRLANGPSEPCHRDSTACFSRSSAARAARARGRGRSCIRMGA